MLLLCLALLYSAALILFLIERWAPAHRDNNTSAERRNWYQRALLINSSNMAVFYAVDTGLSLLQTNEVIVNRGLLEAVGIQLELQNAPFATALLAYVIFTFVVYWWHRLRHSNSFCWRWFHQLHHSPEQIETLTAYYIHPLDLIANLLISNTILYFILGADASAAAIYTLITGLAGFLIHANIRIPRWVGFVFQTPAMHRLHHKSGHHAHNYTDLVIWDMLFGTYQNPKTPVERCGFAKSRQKALRPLLLGKR